LKLWPPTLKLAGSVDLERSRAPDDAALAHLPRATTAA
jgi:hypothetical protein